MSTKHDSICLMKAKDNEPIFVLKASDLLAPAIVRIWAERAQHNGCPQAKVNEAYDLALKMEQWPARKMPD